MQCLQTLRHILALLVHAEDWRHRSMRQLRRMLLSNVYNDKPPLTPGPHHRHIHLLLLCLCLFSPCGPFSDWMNWIGWRVELNNTSYSHNPRPHLWKSLWTSFEGHAVNCKFCKETLDRSDPFYARTISIIYPNASDYFGFSAWRTG